MSSRRSLVLDVGVRMVFHTVLVFSVFLLVSGHNNPGGGFVGGLVAAAAFILRDVAAGLRGRRTSLRLRPDAIAAAGLFLAVVTGIAALLSGGAFLESDGAKVDLPVFGTVKVVSALAFDVGVFLVVLGVTLTVVHHLAEEPDS